MAVHAVTGAFGYSGRYITHRLLAAGEEVRTLTNSRRENPFGDQVRAFPLAFDQPTDLRRALEGVTVLYNTYWVRFNHRRFTFAQAVRNTRLLFTAARDAGVERVVHVSITNPSLDSPLEYFHGKAELEQALAATGVSHAILRPTVLFGREDILINNIAWSLRRLPVFGVFGDGRYRVQPLYVDDLADLAVAQGQLRTDAVIDAIGPETFTFCELVAAVGQAIGRPRPIVGVPPWFGFAASQVIGWLQGDVLLTWQEIQGLMGDLLYTPSPPAGPTRLTAWMAEHAATLGHEYHSELARRR